MALHWHPEASYRTAVSRRMWQDTLASNLAGAEIQDTIELIRVIGGKILSRTHGYCSRA